MPLKKSKDIKKKQSSDGHVHQTFGQFALEFYVDKLSLIPIHLTKDMALVKQLDQKVTQIVETTRKNVLDATAKRNSSSTDSTIPPTPLTIDGVPLQEYIEMKYSEVDALSDEKMGLARKNYERIHRFLKELEGDIDRLKEKSLNGEGAQSIEEPIPSLFPERKSQTPQTSVKEKKKEKNVKLSEIGGLASPSQIDTGSGRSGVAHLEEHNQKLLVSSGADLWTKKTVTGNAQSKRADADVGFTAPSSASKTTKKALKRPRESTTSLLPEEKTPKKRNTTSSKTISSTTSGSLQQQVAQKKLKKTSQQPQTNQSQESAQPSSSAASQNLSSIDDSASQGGDGTESEEVYCFCKQKSYGEMILCDCCGDWFHFGCVGITVAPPDDQPWWCPICR